MIIYLIFNYFIVLPGAGVWSGVKILEVISDRYGHKKLLNTFSIFPSNEDTSDVVVQPYNTILTLKRLIDYSDATFVFHNDSLNRMKIYYLTTIAISNMTIMTCFRSK